MTDEKLTVEQLHLQSKAAADAFVEAVRVASYNLAYAILPLAQRAKDQSMPKDLARAGLQAMFAAFEESGPVIDAAMEKAATDLGIDPDTLH